jgi:hypothetical protein
MKKLTRFKKLIVGTVVVVIVLPLILWIIFINLTNDAQRKLLFVISDYTYQTGNDTSKRVEKVIDWQTFERWVQANVNCEADFVSDSQNKEFLDLIVSLGVKGDMDLPDGPTDTTWLLPRPVIVSGFQSNKLHFWADSGSTFEVEVDASLDRIANAIGAKSIPLYLYKDISYNAVIFKSQPTVEFTTPDLIFVRSSNNKKNSWVGCRSFDS